MIKTQKKLKSYIVIILMIVLSINLYGAEVVSENTTLITDQKNKIEQLVQQEMKKGEIPGVAVAIVRGDKVIYQKEFGNKDKELKQEVTSDTLFELGSTSKAFTGMALLKLVNAGQVRLDDPITTYIPWLKMKYNGKDVTPTVEQFLHQTSGVPFKTIDKIPESTADDALEETVRTLVGIELDSAPGESFQYATINYDVLGLVIEQVTNMTYETYINQNVLKPLGLTNTFVGRSEAPTDKLATGYKISFFKARPYDAPKYKGNTPAGYIITNCNDIAKWLMIQLETARNLQWDDQITRYTHIVNRRVEPIYDGTSYAAGWFCSQKGDGEYFHGGENPNYSSFILFRPEEQFGVAVLGNLDSSCIENIGRGINNILLGKEILLSSKDSYKRIDSVVSIICIFEVIISIFIAYCIAKTIKEVTKKKRSFQGVVVGDVIKLLISMVFIIGFIYCVFRVPDILGNGVSWSFVFVWLPSSIQMALYLGGISLAILYIFFIMTSLYKKKDDTSVILIVTLSILSGLGNFIVIFIINTALTSGNSIHIELGLYFILGIIFYVYGQKVVRSKLIYLTNQLVYLKRLEMIEKILTTSFSKFEKIEKGRIEATLNNDTEAISIFSNIIVGGITSLITIICCFTYLGVINSYGLILSLSVILIIASTYYIVARYAEKMGEQSRDMQNLFFKNIGDLIKGFKELRINGKKRADFKVEMENNCEAYRDRRKYAALAFANMFVVGELLFTVAIGVITFIFPNVFKNIEHSTLTSYVFVLLYMTGPINGVLETIPNIIQVKISYNRMNTLLEELSIMSDSREKTIKTIESDTIFLKLDAVEYEYENVEENPFKIGPINYEFKSGEVVFITGGNGSGKSSLGKLLTGLYKPTKGNIMINEQLIEENQLGEYYTTVFSDFYLFDKLYGIPYAEMKDDIEKYLGILRINHKVTVKNGKFSTTKLSTGQKKRLALLVSYLENKNIFLFDEWAADQDQEFRKFFYEELLPDLKQRGKCVIAITHDEQYFNLADCVIKMEMGEIQTVRK